MIGPSSGADGSQSGHEVVENPGRAKRKVFDEEDAEEEDFCQGSRKRHLALTELQVGDQQTGESQMLIREPGFQEAAAAVSGPVARLEVLVVDGSWDTSTFGASLADMAVPAPCSAGPVLADVQTIHGEGYGTLPFWESPGSIEPRIAPGNSFVDALTCPNPAPDSPRNEDQDNGNLSWLLDFKLDSLIEAPEERSSFDPRDSLQGNPRNKSHGSTKCNGFTTYANDMKRSYSQETSTSLQEPIAPPAYPTSDNRVINSSGRYNGPKKPPFTYTELIEHALQERGELTVSAIYQWISEHFPYYKSNDDRWKNSVRHNLSINPHFRKGSKAPHGAGHLWAIANRGEMRPRQVLPPSGGTGSATSRQQLSRNPPDSGRASIGGNFRKSGNVSSQIVTLDEVAAATASIQQPDDTSNIVNSVTLEHCAEQILSGIKREVEVQYLVPMVVPNDSSQQMQQTRHNGQHIQGEHGRSVSKETDFLNPVSKEVVAEECGLIGEGYLVTDLNPSALGLNMIDPEMITTDSLFGEELSFQFYELTSPSQLQSA